MTDLEIALLVECRAITENTLWNPPKPKGIDEVHDSDEREALAQRYFAACKSGLQFIRAEETGHDPYIVLRAVRYLSSHAVPPMRDSVDWFHEGLHLLLAMACPYFGVPQGGEPFFADLRRGMEQAEKWEAED